MWRLNKQDGGDARRLGEAKRRPDFRDYTDASMQRSVYAH